MPKIKIKGKVVHLPYTAKGKAKARMMMAKKVNKKK